MLKIKDNVDLKELDKILISIAIGITILTVFLLWNTYDIKKLQRENETLNNRITQLEINYKLYDYNINQLKEYRGN